MAGFSLQSNAAERRLVKHDEAQPVPRQFLKDPATFRERRF